MTFPDARTALNALALIGAVGIGAALVFHSVPAGNAQLLSSIVTGLFAVANIGSPKSPPSNPSQ